MCDPISAIIGAVALAGSTAVGMKQAGAAKKAAVAQQANAEKMYKLQEEDTNRRNAKMPNVAALAGANIAGEGAASTALTGPQGIDPSSLYLGKNTALGS